MRRTSTRSAACRRRARARVARTRNSVTASWARDRRSRREEGGAVGGLEAPFLRPTAPVRRPRSGAKHSDTAASATSSPQLPLTSGRRAARRRGNGVASATSSFPSALAAHAATIDSFLLIFSIMRPASTMLACRPINLPRASQSPTCPLGRSDSRARLAAPSSASARAGGGEIPQRRGGGGGGGGRGGERGGGVGGGGGGWGGGWGGGGGGIASPLLDERAPLFPRSARNRSPHSAHPPTTAPRRRRLPPSPTAARLPAAAASRHRCARARRQLASISAIAIAGRRDRHRAPRPIHRSAASRSPRRQAIRPGNERRSIAITAGASAASRAPARPRPRRSSNRGDRRQVESRPRAARACCPSCKRRPRLGEARQRRRVFVSVVRRARQFCRQKADCADRPPPRRR